MASENKRPARPITAEYLFRAAVHYLERYASSSENLRRVLERKVARRALARGEDAADFQPLVGSTVDKIVELKLVDDDAYAEARLASLRRRGTSRRHAAAKLGVKGVPRSIVERVLAEDETEEADAAIRYARRRRLGASGTRDRSERRDRDLAAMMRAGFGYADAVRALDAPAEHSIHADPSDDGEEPGA